MLKDIVPYPYIAFWQYSNTGYLYCERKIFPDEDIDTIYIAPGFIWFLFLDPITETVTSRYNADLDLYYKYLDAINNKKTPPCNPFLFDPFNSVPMDYDSFYNLQVEITHIYYAYGCDGSLPLIAPPFDVPPIYNPPTIN